MCGNKRNMIDLTCSRTEEKSNSYMAVFTSQFKRWITSSGISILESPLFKLTFWPFNISTIIFSPRGASIQRKQNCLLWLL